jgi:CheY-like chemotaxis protein
MNPSIFHTRILVVEDQHLMRELLIESLNSLGFDQVFEAENGRKALELLRRQGIDVLITDVEMQPVDGFELARRIRMGRTRLPRDTAIVFLTGFGDAATRSTAFELDVPLFLVKPVSANQLKEKVCLAVSTPPLVQPAPCYAGVGTTKGGVRRHVADVVPAATRAASGAGEDTAQSTRRVNVLMLEQGMVLARDIYVRDNLLLRRGTRLNALQIDILQEMRALLAASELEILREDAPADPSPEPQQQPPT